MSESAVLYDPDRGCWQRFGPARHVVSAVEAGEVLPALDRVEALVEGEGLHAVGFVAYEAAAVCEPGCALPPQPGLPLLWFALCAAPEIVALPAPPADRPVPDWRPGLDAVAFGRALDAIREQIARGATYQVNFTFPLRAAFHGEPWGFFLGLVRGQQAGQAAYLDTGRFAVCSASPELFFSRRDGMLTTRPMKGTRRRGRTAAGDRRQAVRLRNSPKERAENLMILDMLRNDLARLGGPVHVPELFAAEKYPTLWQLTSTATTPCRASLAEIFTALFPCASITGAPKIRTMQIIAELEGEPRGVYTGAIGHVAPGGRARFGVAIRTALVDRATASAEYRVGAGITWESRSAAEYRECLDKALILTRPQPEFELLETLRWEPGTGFWLLDEHLKRMEQSAEYFSRPWDRQKALAVLAAKVADLPAAPHKVRLLLAADGGAAATAEPLDATQPPPPAGALRLVSARRPVDAADPFLYHKTTWRQVYEQARAEAPPEADEVLLFNERGEVTEALNANLVVEVDGARLTPPVASGLLAGTLRDRLLASGEIGERVLTRADVTRAERIWLINSVRGWREARLVDEA